MCGLARWRSRWASRYTSLVTNYLAMDYPTMECLAEVTERCADGGGVLHTGLGRGSCGDQRDVLRTRRPVGGQGLRHLGRRAGRGQPFEFTEREMVQALELAGQQSSGLCGVGTEPAPHVDAEPGWRGAADGRRGLLDLLFRLGEAAGRAPKRPPAL